MRPAAIVCSITLVGAALLLGLNGIGRSLWLDEAWVANSILQPSIPQMFYYPEWVQSTPPLFLLASRASVAMLGLSNTTLRIVPLLMAMVAAVAMFVAARLVLDLPWAVLASATLVFFTAEVEYSHTAKQYSGEVAATAILLLAAIAYFKQPGAQRFGWLIAAVVVAMPLSYASVFLLPGIVLAVGFKDRRRAITLAAATAAELAIIYIFFIRPNLSGELRAYWSWDPETSLSRGTIGAAAVLVVLAWARQLPLWARQVCALPCILLAASAALHWYPLSYRTRLFVLPCFLLAVLISVEDLCRRWIGPVAIRRAIPVTLLAATLGLGLRAQMRSNEAVPKEDMDGAVRWLKANVGSNDLLVIHPSARETFLLYTRMRNWTTAPALYGNTGWPCCPRGKMLRPGMYSEAALLQDEDRMVPAGFHGDVWMLYTIRHTHWDWVGYDESKLWRSHLADRGCIIGAPIRLFENLGITQATCARVQ